MRPPVKMTSADAHRRALRVLQQGGVVVLPTDTLYGLSAAASSERGIARIRGIKRSPEERAFILLAASVEMAASYTSGFGCTTREELGGAWPAPLTAILPSGPRRWALSGATVALRVPALAWLRSLIDSLGEAIVSTSVNRSGEAALFSADRIEEEFGGDVDLIVVADERRPHPGAKASTLVDFTGTSPRVVRMGDYDWPTAFARDSNPSNS